MATHSKTLALLSGVGNHRLTTSLFVLLVVATILLVVNLVYVGSVARDESAEVRYASELQLISQQLVSNALEAASGQPEAFPRLQKLRQAFQTHWESLVDGDSPAPQMAKLQQDWQVLQGNADSILAQESIILVLRNLATDLVTRGPQLQTELASILELMLSRNTAVSQIVLAERQSLLAERIRGSTSRLLRGEPAAAETFAQDVAEFSRVLTGMQQGAQPGVSMIADREIRRRLEQVATLYQPVAEAAQKILASFTQLQQVRASAQSIFELSPTLFEHALALHQELEARIEARQRYNWVNYGLALVMLVSIILIGVVMVRETLRRLNETAEKNDRNQAAILRLLDEIADLADGDLTVTASVTEDFTGAIADSINYSIDQLRELVQTINQTAVQVAGAAEQTQTTATHLAEASEHQAHEIAGASAAINQIAVSIDQVSANALESAAVAERSVTIANRGNQVVHNTITGMDNIREQIQDTAKRIKRLGESSQEIGDIVGLIDDIADQTNILALNAAIQASMAGDSGRGFAVVADEVQRLAERSSEAAKQIEALVKTIQSDTNEAVISMEQTTSEVVHGAQLAHDAGVALEDIERISRTLAALIQNISNAARQQTASASHIANTMNVIQEITSQTSASTTVTAKSIGNLAQLASELRRSVSDFTLPNTAH